MVTTEADAVGGKNTPGVSSGVTSGEQADINQLTGLASQQQSNANQLFNLAEPGLQQATSFYQTLASGDPFAISRAISPAAQQITQASQGATQNIMNNAPAGGEKNLALEQVQGQAGAQIGNVASQGYLGSFNALGGLSGQGIGESQGASGQALSGISSAISGYGQLGQQQLASQELQLQSKGQTLGAFSGLAGDAASLGGSAMTSGATKGLTAALAA
jgi:hypothetical protein